ncbi:MAG: branched-chain amino acid ABC transporter permease [Clostridiales bacterium]|nr:branched-chain amino acid ABC transporter permease [Clostridiales bacterium]
MKKIKLKDIIIKIAVPAVVIALLYILALTGVFSSNAMRIMLSIALYCALGSMWNLMAGYTGMTSLGQQSFIGIAGYSLAVLTATYGLSYWVGILVGGVLSAILALVLALILFRMRGMYFAVATWVTAEAFKTIFTSWKFVKMGAGMTIKARPYPKSIEIYLISLTLAIICVLVVYLILKSKTGLGLTAMRDDPDAASSVGVNIFKSKLMCFVISGFFTGVTGAVFYLNKGSIFPAGGFGIDWTVSIVFIVIIGGIGTTAGPIVGSIIYVALSEYLSKYPGYSMVILGAIAIIVILVMPYGIVGTIQRKIGREFMSAKRHSLE